MTNYLLVFLTAMTPIGELRAAIPLGLAKNLSIFWVYLIAVIGNLIPVIFILLLASRFCPKWLCCHVKNKHNHKFIKWGDLALVFFVAIPLPFTGAWTGALAAVVFGVKFWKALALISIGVIIAGIIVSLLSLGFLSL
ncbi:MAG: small multi-drug export protein [bacterium]